MSYVVALEKAYIKRTIAKSKPHDLAVIDTDGINTAAIKAACARGVWAYGYINAGRGVIPMG